MATQRTLKLIASKLGLAKDEKVLSKAAELERLLQTKSMTGSNLSDTSKTVVCLDLAATILGAEFDMKTAIKYSGLKPQMYTKSKKTVENLLEITNKLCISTLCVSLNCSSEVQALADKILEEYNKYSKMELDLNLPQYVCMAVYQACRLSKVKVPKSKLIEKSCLKPAQWTKFDSDWTKFVEEKFSAVQKKKSKSLKAAEVDNEKDIEMVNTEEPMELQIESYEDWKTRILAEARKELALLKCNTPRRSPRKTPQKHSPYKTPGKVPGVRLLFPTEL